MTRGVTDSSVTLHLPAGPVTVPVAIAWAQCACGEAIAAVADTRDPAIAAVADAEDEAGWSGDRCPGCARGAR